MKPTPQISPKQYGSRRNRGGPHSHWNFPLTDYPFQATVEAKSNSSSVSSATKSPAFHKLSSEFLGAETSRDYIVELSAFAVISVVSAWPVISSIVAVVRMLRNY
jgi:hypothetical protein